MLARGSGKLGPGTGHFTLRFRSEAERAAYLTTVYFELNAETYSSVGCTSSTPALVQLEAQPNKILFLLCCAVRVQLLAARAAS